MLYTPRPTDWLTDCQPPPFAFLPLASCDRALTESEFDATVFSPREDNGDITIQDRISLFFWGGALEKLAAALLSCNAPLCLISKRQNFRRMIPQVLLLGAMKNITFVCWKMQSKLRCEAEYLKSTRLNKHPHNLQPLFQVAVRFQDRRMQNMQISYCALLDYTDTAPRNTLRNLFLTFFLHSYSYSYCWFSRENWDSSEARGTGRCFFVLAAMPQPRFFFFLLRFEISQPQRPHILNNHQRGRLRHII